VKREDMEMKIGIWTLVYRYTWERAEDGKARSRRGVRGCEVDQRVLGKGGV